FRRVLFRSVLCLSRRSVRGNLRRTYTYQSDPLHGLMPHCAPFLHGGIEPRTRPRLTLQVLLLPPIQVSVVRVSPQHLPLRVRRNDVREEPRQRVRRLAVLPSCLPHYTRVLYTLAVP